MRLRDFIKGRKRLTASWVPETGTEDEWTPVERGFGRQDEGPIRAPLRNRDTPTNRAHTNRAGRRQYVRDLQTRQVRKNIVGFGRWRRHDEQGLQFEHAKLTAVTPLEPRAVRRIAQLEVYRAAKRNRNRRVTT